MDADGPVPRAPADFHRRRHHRRVGIRGAAGIRRPGLLGWARASRPRRLVRDSRRRAGLALSGRGWCRSKRAVIEHGLDLAVIGNGRTAALVDPSSRIVWWCFPRFDSDPVFCRLLAGGEEKGFTDVVLDHLVETKSEYVRNTAIVTTTLRDREGGAVRITE